MIKHEDVGIRTQKLYNPFTTPVTIRLFELHDEVGVQKNRMLERISHHDAFTLFFFLYGSYLSQLQCHISFYLFKTIIV